MRQAKGLLPYAALAVLIVGVTVVALVVTTLGPQATLQEPTASPTATAAATAVNRPATDLSTSGRLAYWRTEANGDYQLWLANADNSRRRSVAKADPSTVARTKWAVDGSAVAYVESGVRLVVIAVDGVKATYTLSQELRNDGYRIVDSRFSPSSARVAATVQRVSSSISDVFVTAPGGQLTRLTTTEDVLAADWISEDELLVQTIGGIVGRLRATGRDQLRPLTGLQSATPIVGDDGRIYFLSGRVNGFASSTETLVFAAAASIYSVTVDGEDLRKENVQLESDSFRLDGLWPGGGYLLHRGTNPAQVALGLSVTKTFVGPVELPQSAGQLERLQVSSDKRFAIGFTGNNLVRLDIGAQGAPVAASVLLGSVPQGDAWFPRTIALTQHAPVKADVPAARYVFALGGNLWQMGADGLPTLLRAGNTNAQTLRRFTLWAPQWSPGGDKVLTVESLSTGSAAFQLIAVVIDRNGGVKRFTTPSSIGPVTSWSPEGTQFAIVAYPAASTDPTVLSSELSVQLLDATSGSVANTFPGREAYWTKAGVYLISNGTFRLADRARDDQSIEVWSAGQRRPVVTIAKLIADPRMQAPASARGNTQVRELSAAPDGQHLSVHVSFVGTQTVPTFAVVRARDGTPSAIVAGDAVNDEAWSSTNRYIGYTLTAAQQGAAPKQRAVVRDAETGDVVVDQEGRFAGWSPDGLWMYAARAEGLFARRIGGGEPVRFSSLGVVVNATNP